MHTPLHSLYLSESLTTNQAPQSAADFWFMLAIGLITILIAIVGWIFVRLISQVNRLIERIDKLDRYHADRHSELRLEVTRVSGRLEHLEGRHAT